MKKLRQLLGKSFKAESNLTLGSPALLLQNVLKERKIEINIWDPIVDKNFEEYAKKYKWNSEKFLKPISISKMPDYIKENSDKYSEWLDS